MLVRVQVPPWAPYKDPVTSGIVLKAPPCGAFAFLGVSGIVRQNLGVSGVIQTTLGVQMGVPIAYSWRYPQTASEPPLPLTFRQVLTAEPKSRDYRLSDGQNLYLQVSKSGRKYWRMKYRYEGREKMLALGVFPEVSLKAARLARDDAKSLLRQNIDPMLQKTGKAIEPGAPTGPSFQEVGQDWFDVRMADKSPSHRSRTWRALERDLFPYLGHRAINTIEPIDVLQALRRIEERGHYELAQRTRRVASQIFQFAVITGLVKSDPTSALSNALKKPKVQHFAAITDPEEVADLLRKIDSYQGSLVVEAALKLTPLFFCRPGELRHLEWADVNWQADRIEIPGERMKMGTPHIIPLTSQSKRILTDLEKFTGSGRYIFPSMRSASRPMSENAVRTALRAMEYENDAITPHGFRAMARTLLDEELGFPVAWIEHQLAHSVQDALGRAYNRTAHIEQRRHMLQVWADYLDALKLGEGEPAILRKSFHYRPAEY